MNIYFLLVGRRIGVKFGIRMGVCGGAASLHGPKWPPAVNFIG